MNDESENKLNYLRPPDYRSRCPREIILAFRRYRYKVAGFISPEKANRARADPVGGSARF